MKKIFSAVFLTIIFIVSASASEYRVYGNLSNGGIIALVNNPSGYNTIGKGHKITPNFRGKRFTFAIDVKSNEVRNNAQQFPLKL